MLASHPDSCLICDKGNRCQLRQLASELGIGLVEFQRIPQLSTIEEVNPFIERDLSKCILCAKCIRADQEIVVEGAIDYLSRGSTSKPATLNDTWGYKSFDHDWKSTDTLIRNLVDIASKGGNYLLNVGPTKEGLIPEPSVKRLKAMGQWMKINGQSIYGTTASPFPAPAWGRYTKKPGVLYAHVFRWPRIGTLDIPLKDAQIKSVRLLTTDGPVDLKYEKTARGIAVHVPEKCPDPIPSVVVIEHDE